MAVAFHQSENSESLCGGAAFARPDYDRAMRQGAVDSIADIIAIAVAADDLAPDGVVVSDLPCGYGTVRCQHGLIPVPAPATAFIAEAAGLTLSPVDVEGELVTPTGAAAAAALRTEAALPERFSIKAIGMGAGKRAYDTPGILRAMIIEPAE